MSLDQLPDEIICMIADYARWFPFREVCKTVAGLIPMSKRIRRQYYVNTLMIGSFDDIRTIWLKYIHRKYPNLGPANLGHYGNINTTHESHYLTIRGDLQLANDLMDYGIARYGHGAVRQCVTLAAQYGHFDMLKQFYHRVDLFPSIADVKDGDEQILNWLIPIHKTNNVTIDERYIAACFSYGKINTGKWLISRGYRPGVGSVILTTMNGDYHITKWLVSIGCPLDNEALAVCESVNMIKWLCNNGCQWNVKTLRHHIRINRFDVVKYCIRAGCPTSVYTTKEAAKHDRFEILNWLLDEGCDVDEQTPKYLINNYYDGVVGEIEKKQVIVDRILDRLRNMGLTCDDSSDESDDPSGDSSSETDD